MVTSDAVTRLGRSSLEVGRLGFGCEQLGGYEWGNVDPRDVHEAIELALERGITLFDTADCYGRGESERRLGRILARHRERALIATKFGVRFTDAGAVYYDASPEWAEQALDESLRRLGTDFVDVLQMHYWDGNTSLKELFDRLETLRERRKIRWYGVTNYLPDAIDTAGYPGLVSVSLQYSLVHRQHERAVLELRSRGLTFLAYGSLGQGILSGKYRPGTRFGSDDRRSRASYKNFHGEQFLRNSRIVEVVEKHARVAGVSASQIAIAWILNTIPGSVALVGVKQRAQLEDVVEALSLQLFPETIMALDSASAGTAPDAGE